MPPESLTLALGLSAVLATLCIGIWRHHSKIEKKYGDDYYEYEDYQWSEFSSDLGELVAEINQLTDFNPQNAEADVPPQGEIITVIHNNIDREEMENIESSLREFDTAIELKSEAKDYYMSSYRFLGISCIIVVLIAIGIVAVESQKDWVPMLVSAVFPGFLGVLKARNGYSCEMELDNLIDDYRSPRR
ncbi:hypothetical protein [Halococcoides cellulosivorans]|uniref:hypothetical protein n=1 Tax=Halococcoides cellulosivorans TaxID=1679096 RepID=UPI00131EEE37|nr:hypothetical protein [Halococcoides cellulosivorans]